MMFCNLICVCKGLKTLNKFLLGIVCLRIAFIGCFPNKIELYIECKGRQSYLTAALTHNATNSDSGSQETTRSDDNADVWPDHRIAAAFVCCQTAKDLQDAKLLLLCEAA